jgi:sigma-B regulation protein RsbU (phosphoserine phosphatase)
MFDVFTAGDAVIAVIADVAGKGSPASLLTATVHAAAQRAALALGPDPSAIVAAVDDEILPLLERTDRIVTLAVAAIEVGRGAITVASAGHSPIALFGAGRATLVEPASPPLGAGRFHRQASSLRVAPGDVLVMASDGTLDQTSSTGEWYGLDRLLATIQKTGGASAAGVVDGIFADLDAFAGSTRQDDDQAVVALRIEDTQ